MTDKPLTRRTVLGTVAALLATVFGVSTGAARERAVESPSAVARRTATNEPPAADQLSRKLRTGIYDGTIDRIVDGDHVVILLESDGETVGQRVLDRDGVPDGEEGDSVTVWLFRGVVIAVQVG